MPYPKNAELHSWWQESQRDFADTTWRRTSASFIGLPAMQLLLATRKRVTTQAFLPEEGGPLAVEGARVY